MVYFFYNIEDEIRRARGLYSLYGRDIPGDSRCSGLLGQYHAAIEDSWILMNDLGVVDICSACAGQKPGGCCYYGVETWYSNTVLLINMLLDIKIPETRKLEKNCLFAGENGCRLRARFKTCIHHLCPKIKDSLNEYDLFRLRAVTNHEIKIGVQTESAIRDWIRDKGQGREKRKG